MPACNGLEHTRNVVWIEPTNFLNAIAERVRRFLRNHPKLVWSIGAAVVMLVVVALLIIWESGYECVRWSTRINMDTHGGVYHERVCAETRSRWGEMVGK